jgi:hypothetical protein
MLLMLQQPLLSVVEDVAHWHGACVSDAIRCGFLVIAAAAAVAAAAAAAPTATVR